MKHRFIPMVLFVLVCLNLSAFAQTTYYLPQVANGNFGSGSYKTTFVLFNNTNNAALADLDLTDDKGNPLTMTIPGYGADSSFSIDLPAGASKLLQTDGKGTVATGAATVTSSASIGVSAIFSIYDGNGNYQTETGVGSSDPQSTFVLPVDTTGSFSTGLALYNPSGDSANITMTLRNTSGMTMGTYSLKMDSDAHLAKFVSEFFPSAGATQGTLLVQSSAKIAATVLRQYLSPSALSFTSLPVVPTSSTKTTLNLAQVANGGGYQTSFLIFNISSSPANVTLTLTKDDGTPLNVTMVGGASGSAFSINNLAIGGAAFLQTDGKSSSTTVGAAKITSNVPIGASGVFTVLNAGVFQTETGVSDSPLLTSFTLPVDITGNFDTGVAFFNSGTAAATLKFRRLDASGAQVGTEVTYPSTPIPASGHTAVFVSQIFGVSNVRGSVAVSSSTPVAAMTLRMNNAPLSFTTLPVVSGVSTGSGGGGGGTGTALLQKSEAGIAATTNVTVNETLPSGFKLSGTVSGPGTGGGVIARSGQTTMYAGVITAGKYQVVLPAGTYDLSAVFTPNGAPSGASLMITSLVASGVQVTSDTTRNITLPSVTLYNVSGSVNGLSSLGNTNALEMGFASGDGNVEASFPLAANGSYSGVLPAGSYTAGISASIAFSLATLQNQTLGIFTLGTPTIGGNTTLPAYSIPPLARLSGTVKGAGMPAIGLAVSAVDANSAIVSSSSPDMLTVQYQALLPKNISYSVNVSMIMIQGTSSQGAITFPLTPTPLNLANDTSGYDFTVPSLPSRVTISGKVTDSSGNPVNGAMVSLYCESVSNTPNVRFVHSARTDASGNYSVSVLSGTNYTMVFIPPLGN